MSASGTCKTFCDGKGWGFVVYEGQDVFVHVKDCTGGKPDVGDILWFDLEDNNGKMRAKNVTGGSRSMEDMSKGGGKGKGKGKGKDGWGGWDAWSPYGMMGGWGGGWGGMEGGWGKGKGKGKW
eukprot:TRINITY_DN2272_c4_g1_i1.p3 TRINITY_DN2272_c4_g1~~TRINITY_DN2272_c4_g1_i1.p3  ORF type:complete len:123 (-),score=48.41 TRINITY_DN2272_c4_g1_i1:31-399(-)